MKIFQPVESIPGNNMGDPETFRYGPLFVSRYLANRYAKKYMGRAGYVRVQSTDVHDSFDKFENRP